MAEQPERNPLTDALDSFFAAMGVKMKKERKPKPFALWWEFEEPDTDVTVVEEIEPETVMLDPATSDQDAMHVGPEGLHPFRLSNGEIMDLSNILPVKPGDRIRLWEMPARNGGSPWVRAALVNDEVRLYRTEGQALADDARMKMEREEARRRAIAFYAWELREAYRHLEDPFRRRIDYFRLREDDDWWFAEPYELLTLLRSQIARTYWPTWEELAEYLKAWKQTDADELLTHPFWQEVTLDRIAGCDRMLGLDLDRNFEALAYALLSFYPWASFRGAPCALDAGPHFAAVVISLCSKTPPSPFTL